jgi:hypothetical protein
MHIAIRNQGQMKFLAFGEEGLMEARYPIQTIWNRIRYYCPEYQIEALFHHLT